MQVAGILDLLAPHWAIRFIIRLLQVPPGSAVIPCKCPLNWVAITCRFQCLNSCFVLAKERICLNAQLLLLTICRLLKGSSFVCRLQLFANHVTGMLQAWYQCSTAYQV